MGKYVYGNCNGILLGQSVWIIKAYSEKVQFAKKKVLQLEQMFKHIEYSAGICLKGINDIFHSLQEYPSSYKSKTNVFYNFILFYFIIKK